jgi:hypothetical protein
MWRSDCGCLFHCTRKSALGKACRLLRDLLNILAGRGHDGNISPRTLFLFNSTARLFVDIISANFFQKSTCVHFLQKTNAQRTNVKIFILTPLHKRCCDKTNNPKPRCTVKTSRDTTPMRLGRRALMIQSVLADDRRRQVVFRLEIIFSRGTSREGAGVLPNELAAAVYRPSHPGNWKQTRELERSAVGRWSCAASRS